MLFSRLRRSVRIQKTGHHATGHATGRTTGHTTVTPKTEERRPSFDSAWTLTGGSSLDLCECKQLGMEILHTIAGIPSFSEFETKESGLLCLEDMISLFDKMSLCQKCSEHEHSPEFLGILCNKILAQCQLFRGFLNEMLEQNDQDQQSLLQRDYATATSQERMSLLCSLTYLQMKRLYGCVARLNEKLEEESTFDEDSWSHLRGQCFQLAIDSATLCSRATYFRNSVFW
ncbi:hypothetical protein P170DRAFT_472545 [Aspergillus steynii IBT 23096]|uniref:Uncharacterized protein n=1 Tax=Aspergillus steynii IBT 23096 TaxID=1392250 RepID=A0A2I2GIE5_9EURO|nr:uncharacterized protein P170DRAFT_472545 [Aspergillus steynii IBT 23096]PLB52656.1 hypothetical protein P170DRAFT_472545 [Aspergillus steynii IBT 23096]